ncbi:MAG: hypothetical protein HY559_00265 [Gammaproteobacteria bacterium]|nr:hypothetical protein [Gammaproteobacteria bacterium]
MKKYIMISILMVVSTLCWNIANAYDPKLLTETIITTDPIHKLLTVLAERNADASKIQSVCHEHFFGVNLYRHPELKTKIAIVDLFRIKGAAEIVTQFGDTSFRQKDQQLRLWLCIIPTSVFVREDEEK